MRLTDTNCQSDTALLSHGDLHMNLSVGVCVCGQRVSQLTLL